VTRSSLRATLIKGELLVVLNLLLLEIVLQLLYWVTSGGGWLAARVSQPICAFNKRLGICRLRSDFAYQHKTSEFSVPITIDSRFMRVGGVARRSSAAAAPTPSDAITVAASGPSNGFGWGSAYEAPYYPRMAAVGRHHAAAGGRP
jgi:hypothetical protein